MSVIVMTLLAVVNPNKALDEGISRERFCLVGKTMLLRNR